MLDRVTAQTPSDLHAEPVRFLKDAMFHGHQHVFLLIGHLGDFIYDSSVVENFSGDESCGSNLENPDCGVNSNST